MQHHEENAQIAFFDWVDLQTYGRDLTPLHEFCFANPNGGNRDTLEAKRLKAQGVLAGVSDIFLMIAKQGYHGLWIEMKHGDNELSDKQKIFKKNAVRAGYQHVTCYSVDDAIEEVTLYLTTGETPQAGIKHIDDKQGYKFLAICRRMSKKFKRKPAAINWLARRGFNEDGKRI